MRAHAETIRFRKPHIQSAYISSWARQCASALCGLCVFAILLAAFYALREVVVQSHGRNERQRVAAAIKRDQGYRFSRLKGPLEFSDWSQERNLVRHCNGAYEVYGDAFARLFDVVVHPSRAAGPAGGELIASVLNRSENDEYLKLANGFFTLSCAPNARSFANPFAPKPVRNVLPRRKAPQPARSFLNEFHDALLLTDADAADAQAARYVNETIFAITRYEYANLFHTVTYLYNAFLTSKAVGVSCDEVHVLFVDAHAQSPLDQVWSTLFRSVSRVRQLQDMRVKQLVWLPLGYSSPLMNEALQQIPLLEEFRSYYLTKYGLASLINAKKLDCSNISVTFLFRRNYIAHPRNPSGSVSRRLRNEDELLQETIRTFKSNAGVRVNVQGLAFEPLSMREQLVIIAHTDILIGMHGAGLTHILFLPRHAAVVEMFMSGTRASHYEAFARWRSLKYKLYQNRNRMQQTQDSLYVPPLAISILIDTLLTEMQCCSKTCITTSEPA